MAERDERCPDCDATRSVDTSIWICRECGAYVDRGIALARTETESLSRVVFDVALPAPPFWPLVAASATLVGAGCVVLALMRGWIVEGPMPWGLVAVLGLGVGVGLVLLGASPNPRHRVVMEPHRVEVDGVSIPLHDLAGCERADGRLAVTHRDGVVCVPDPDGRVHDGLVELLARFEAASEREPERQRLERLRDSTGV